MSRPVSRRYQVLPDRGVCLKSGCPWHEDGDRAEDLAAVHHDQTGHDVRVRTGSDVIFSRKQPQAVA